MSAPCSHVGAQVDGDVGNVSGWSLGSPLVLTSSKQRGEVRQTMEDHIQAFMSMAWKWGGGEGVAYYFCSYFIGQTQSFGHT